MQERGHKKNASAESRLRAFSNLGHRLSSARTQREAIKIILDAADQFIGWDACTFDSYTAKDDIVRGVIVVDRMAHERREFQPLVRFRKPTPRMRSVIENGAQLILRESPLQMPADAVPTGDQSKPSASLLFVPVRSGKTVIGLLSIQSYTVSAYTLEDLSFLQALADHGAGALERIQAEERIKDLNNELEDRITERTAALVATVGELEAFSYSVSHDMRAPLRAMQGYAQILLEDYPGKVLDGTATEYLTRIARASVRLDAFIQDVLTYAKVLRGEAPVKAVDLMTLIKDVLDAHPEWDAPATRIEIQPLPPILGHEALLSQCVAHLLSNAIKFCKEKDTPHVRIYAENKGDQARITFADNGIGIEPQFHQKIFGMFERIHPSTDVEGTGIGLTIVRKAVQRMHGTVGFESSPGNGSQFWIQLPLAM